MIYCKSRDRKIGFRKEGNNRKGVSLMSIKEFEFYHGAVLTKIARNDSPITLRMIETNRVGSWGAYRINDEVVVHVKYSSKPSHYDNRRKVMTWGFTFNQEEL